MENLRTLAEKDLRDTLEGEFGLPVVLIVGDGASSARYDKTTDGRPLVGQVLWSQPTINPDTGEKIAIYAPVVTLRRSSLPRVPKSGEDWIVLLPEGPADTGVPSVAYRMDPAYAVEGGKSLGKVRIPLVAAKQAVLA
jgi:hypothetical protein